jgi:polyhydroxybutyrate depolymerase
MKFSSVTLAIDFFAMTVACGPTQPTASGKNIDDQDTGGGGVAGGPTQPAASGGSESEDGDGGSPAAWSPGDYPPDVNAQTYLEISGVSGQGDRVRQYKVHVPPSYDPRVPAPLVFCIHGLLQNAVMFCVAGAALHTKADQAGFILVMPNGYANSWNGGTCCGAASDERIDDVALFRAIFAEVSQHLNVDRRRVYATGLSNGAYMSYRLACQAADLFAAIVPGAGAVGINSIGGGTSASSDFTECAPTKPVAVLALHGTADGLVPYRLQAPSLAQMIAGNACSTTTMPATQPRGGGDTNCFTYAGCANGAEVTACSVSGGGHCWFGSPDCGTGAGVIGAAVVGANSNTLINNDEMWSFFERSLR